MKVKFDKQGNRIEVEEESKIKDIKCKKCGKVRDKNTSWVADWCASCYCEILAKRGK